MCVSLAFCSSGRWLEEGNSPQGAPHQTWTLRSSQGAGDGRGRLQVCWPGAPSLLGAMPPRASLCIEVVAVLCTLSPFESPPTLWTCAGCLREHPSEGNTPHCQPSQSCGRWDGKLWSKMVPPRGREPHVSWSERLKEGSWVRTPAGSSSSLLPGQVFPPLGSLLWLLLSPSSLNFPGVVTAGIPSSPHP